MSTREVRARTRKDPHQRSAEIHASAISLAREQGLSILTLRSVASRAGVAPGLVAHYAGSMDDLVAHAFRELVASELDEVRNQVQTTIDPLDQLARMIATVLSAAHDDITLVWVDAWSLGRSNNALSIAIEEQMDAWQAFITRIIEDGRHVGVFRTNAPETVSWQILAMLDGISAHARTRGTDTALFGSRLAQACEALVGAASGSIVERLSE